MTRNTRSDSRAAADHPPRVADVVRDRLLARHVLARAQRGDRVLGVQRRGAQDLDRVDVVVGEQLRRRRCIPARLPTRPCAARAPRVAGRIRPRRRTARVRDSRARSASRCCPSPRCPYVHDLVVMSSLSHSSRENALAGAGPIPPTVGRCRSPRPTAPRFAASRNARSYERRARRRRSSTKRSRATSASRSTAGRGSSRPSTPGSTTASTSTARPRTTCCARWPAAIEACVTITLIDALVLARSAFHHSMNYRSVMVFGPHDAVDDVDEKRAALHALVEHVVPGRTADARPPSESELRSDVGACGCRSRGLGQGAHRRPDRRRADDLDPARSGPASYRSSPPTARRSPSPTWRDGPGVPDRLSPPVRSDSGVGVTTRGAALTPAPRATNSYATRPTVGSLRTSWFMTRRATRAGPTRIDAYAGSS